MRSLEYILACASFASLAAAVPATNQPLAPLTAVTPAANTTGGYIVVLKDEVQNVQSVITQLSLPNATLQAGSSIMGIHKEFDTVLKGWAGKFDDATLLKIRQDPRVAYVEPDIKMSINYQQKGGPYGLAISSQKKKMNWLDMNNYWWKDPGGRGVTVYVIDTGIAPHPDFGGRARMVANFVPNSPSNTDDHGHGTHCAGTIGSKTYGIAKNVNLAGVKVLDFSGYGDNSNVITGINFAVRHCGGDKCVISMSLGGVYSEALNQAVANAVSAGVPVVVAAGNSAEDACNGSPSSAPSAITVGAIDFTYTRTDFSNWGRCLDFFAPGYDIDSTWPGPTDHSLSGTSMACPHVAGIAAYHLASGRATKANLTTVLINRSQKNLVKDPKGSPNRIANNGYWLP